MVNYFDYSICVDINICIHIKKHILEVFFVFNTVLVLYIVFASGFVRVGALNVI